MVDALDLPALVRTRDYRRFLAIQLAPRTDRPTLYALTAFADEMARIPSHVSEPLAGFMRYAWWREALAAMQAGKPPRAHPLLQALAPFLARHPSAFATLCIMIEAGQMRLDDGAFADNGERAHEALNQCWNLQLSGEENPATQPPPCAALLLLPTQGPIGLRHIWRLFLYGLKS